MEAVSSRRVEEEPTVMGKARMEQELQEGEKCTLTMTEAIDSKKQQIKSNIFNEKKTNGAVKDFSETKPALKFNEKAKDDTSFWKLFELKSVKKTIPGFIQEL